MIAPWLSRSLRLLPVACCLAAGAAQAVPADLPVRELIVNRWADPPGLSLPQVSAIVVTSEGFLWAGTRDGLARFDGRTFREHTVPGARAGSPVWVNDLALDGRGNPVAAVLGNAGLFGFRGDRWETVTGTAPMGECRVLLAAKQHLWVGAERGLYALGADGVRQVAGAETIGTPLSLATGHDGRLWIGSTTGVFTWDGARVGVHAGVPREAVRALTVARTGDLWLGAASGLRRAGQPAVGLPAGRTYALVEDRDGTLWVGNRIGLYRWNGKGFEAVPGVGGPVWDLAEDREGNLWAATSGGLTRVRAPLFRRVPGADVVSAFHLDANDDLWVGMPGRGLGLHRQGLWRWWAPSDGLCTTAITALVRARDGRLWIGGDPGERSTLCRFDGTAFVAPEGGPTPDDPIRALFEDSRGQVWVGGQRLYRADGDRMLPQPVPGNPTIERIKEIDGQLWLATRDGLWRRQGEGWVAARGPKESYDWFYDFTSDGNGGLFLAGESGFARLTPDGQLSVFTRPSGFMNPEVFGLHRVGDVLWLATRNGPVAVREAHIRAREQGASAEVPRRRFGRADGLPADTVLTAGTSVLAQDKRGQLWFATAGGLAVVDPAHIRLQPTPPVAVIERVLINGEPVATDAPVRRPRHRGALQIEYTAPALSHPEALRFRHRLEPLDRDWVEAGAGRSAHYTNLPPGQYRFQVSAALASASFAERGAALTVEFEPRLHERPSFRVGLFLALLAAAVWVHRRRTARVRALETVKLAERTRIARELHDTLAQSVNAVAYRLEEARMNEGELRGEARALVDAAWKLSLATVEEARQAIWQLRNGVLDTADLPAALARVAAATGGEVPVRALASGERWPVAPAAAQALLRIAQEAITNAIRYARATRIDVELRFYGDRLELTIVDDGAGMATPNDPPAGRFGIVGMRERAAEIGGTLELDSSPGRGTTVRISVPREVRT